MNQNAAEVIASWLRTPRPPFSDATVNELEPIIERAIRDAYRRGVKDAQTDQVTPVNDEGTMNTAGRDALEKRVAALEELVYPTRIFEYRPPTDADREAVQRAAAEMQVGGFQVYPTTPPALHRVCTTNRPVEPVRGAKPTPPDNPIVSAAASMASLKDAFQRDSGYAWSWHCNLACCAMDEGMEHGAANRAAARFMKLAFGVESKEPARSVEDKSNG
jgi:hypothetical protein